MGVVVSVEGVVVLGVPPRRPVSPVVEVPWSVVVAGVVASVGVVVVVDGVVVVMGVVPVEVGVGAGTVVVTEVPEERFPIWSTLSRVYVYVVEAMMVVSVYRRTPFPTVPRSSVAGESPVERMIRSLLRSVSVGSVQVRVTPVEVGDAWRDVGFPGGVVSEESPAAGSVAAKYEREVVVNVQVPESTVQEVREEVASEKFPSVSRYTSREVPWATVVGMGMAIVIAAEAERPTEGTPYWMTARFVPRTLAALLV